MSEDSRGVLFIAGLALVWIAIGCVFVLEIRRGGSRASALRRWEINAAGLVFFVLLALASIEHAFLFWPSIGFAVLQICGLVYRFWKHSAPAVRHPESDTNHLRPHDSG